MSLQRTKPKNLRNLREDFAKLASLGVVEEDDDLNEGFCHYSIADDEQPRKVDLPFRTDFAV